MTNDDVANDNTTPLNMSGLAQSGTYTFYVTQASDKKMTPSNGFSGDPFFGSEGEPLEFTIYVRDAPVASRRFGPDHCLSVRALLFRPSLLLHLIVKIPTNGLIV